MSEDKKPDVVPEVVDVNADTDPPASQEEGLGIQNPLLAYVQDGTTTWASEQENERKWHDSEKRRDVAARERAVANVPIEQGGGMLSTHKLTDNPEVPKAYIPLKYVNAYGAETGLECMADLIIGCGENPMELMLIIVCPNCAHNRRLHHDQAQIQIRQTNKNFHFVAGKGDPTFLFDDGNGPMQYNSAGMIMECEKFTCPNCSWSARIDRNLVIPER
jgi:uncharacterized protein YbaR (Trm112 family)